MELNPAKLKELNIKMGSLPEEWMGGVAKNITFCVTEECNLRCKYCYMVHKNSHNKMSWDIARDAIEFFLTNRNEFPEKAVIFDFIGGEPFLMIDLIDQMCDYIKKRMYELDHPWFDNYMFSFSTNGMNYRTEKVQKYIEKNSNHLSIGITIDGNKIKHDLQRVKPDGSGSYDEVYESVKLWMKQFPGMSTKSTFAHDDLVYLKESIIHLWNIGIKEVAANIVFEDVWKEGDERIFEEQLVSLADYIIENKMWQDYSVRFFDPNIGYPISESERKRNFCGSGKMIAVDYKGDLFPCMRFCDLSLSNKPGYVTGNIYMGIDSDLLRPFQVLSLEDQSTKECIDCEVASGCAWCSGCNYDLAESDTLYQRATYLCKMHKANIRAKKYFWNKLAEVDPAFAAYLDGAKNKHSRFLMLITSDSITPHCSYKTKPDSEIRMTEEIYKKALGFAKEHNMEPVILGASVDFLLQEKNHLHIVNQFEAAESLVEPGNLLVVYENDVKQVIPDAANAVLVMENKNLERILELVTLLHENGIKRINLILKDLALFGQQELNQYSNILDQLVNYIHESYKDGNPLSLNILTDILEMTSMHNCDAGETSIAVSPDGRLYLCPAFYFNNPDDCIGSLDAGYAVKNRELLNLDHAPLCRECDAFHCSRCKFLNKTKTRNINIPSKMQCMVSHLEREKAQALQQMLYNDQIQTEYQLANIGYKEPLEKVLALRGEKY